MSPPLTNMKVSSCNVNVNLHVKNDIDMICLKQRSLTGPEYVITFQLSQALNFLYYSHV